MKRDKLILSGLVFYAHYGVHKAERELGQQVRVDLELFRDLSEAGRHDNLTHTVDYTTIYDTIQQVIDAGSFYLIEAIAEAIAQMLLAEYPIDAVTVRVTKTKLPFRGQLESVAAELYRERG